MKEIWKDVYEYEELYQISNIGNIKSLERIIFDKNNRKIKIQKKNMRHTKIGNSKVVTLCKNGISSKHTLNRLMYKAFHPEFNINDDTIAIFSRDEKDKYNINNLYMVINYNNNQIICTTTNKKFNSIEEANRFYDIKAGAISRCCKGERKSAGKLNNNKLVWKYLKENEISI